MFYGRILATRAAVFYRKFDGIFLQCKEGCQRVDSAVRASRMFLHSCCFSVISQMLLSVRSLQQTDNYRAWLQREKTNTRAKKQRDKRRMLNNAAVQTLLLFLCLKMYDHLRTYFKACLSFTSSHMYLMQIFLRFPAFSSNLRASGPVSPTQKHLAMYVF